MDPQTLQDMPRNVWGLARQQHGVVTRRQLLECGFSAEAIKHRRSSGRLHAIARGVYSLGRPDVTHYGRWVAAVLSCGEAAVLSHRSAAALWAIAKEDNIEVSVPSRRSVCRPGLLVHRRATLHAADCTRRYGIPATTVPATLVDLAAVLGTDPLARACHEAGIRYGTTPAQVDAVLARRGLARGVAELRAVLRGDVQVMLSKLERGFRALLKGEKLLLPRTNRPAGGRRVDCWWPEQHLIVELDSYWYHRSRYAWEQDRRREREARAAGNEFRRYTWGDVFEHPSLMLRELRQLIPTARS